jgi:signal transduction histidine kinase
MNPIWRVVDSVESGVAEIMPDTQVAVCESDAGKGYVVFDFATSVVYLSGRLCKYLYGNALFRPDDKRGFPESLRHLIDEVKLANSEVGISRIFGEPVQWSRLKDEWYAAYIIQQIRTVERPFIPHPDWRKAVELSGIVYWKYYPLQDRLDSVWSSGLPGQGKEDWCRYFELSEREYALSLLGQALEQGKDLCFTGKSAHENSSATYWECYGELNIASNRQPCVLGYLKPASKRETSEASKSLQLENLLNLNNQVQGGLSQYLIRKNGVRKWLYLSLGMQEIYEQDLNLIMEDSYNLESLVHPEDTASLINQVKNSMRSLQPFQTKHRLRFPDGRIKWISLHSTPEMLPDGDILWHAYHQDITEQYKTSEQVQEHHKELLSLSSNIPGGIFILEIPPGKPAFFRFVSQQVEEMHLYSPGEVYLYPRKLLRDIDSADRRGLLKTLFQATWNIEPFEYQYRFIKPDGSEHWHKVKAKPGRSITGAVKFYGYFEDISELRNKEDRLRELVELTSDQNKRLLDFAYMVSHNLRAHSSNMQGIMDLLTEEEMSELSEMYVGMLQKSLSKLNSTLVHLDHIVSVKNNPTSLMKRINLKHEIDRVFEILTLTGKSLNAHLSNYVPADVFIDAVPAYLESIILNLLSNGIKYRNPERDPEISIHYFRDSSNIKLEVRDNGIGIDMKKYKSKLFGLYQTFHMHPEARGMGLFLVRSHMQAMGGEVSCESEPGVGSRFILKFPVSVGGI